MIRLNDIMKFIFLAEENPETLARLRDLLEEPRRIVITLNSGLETLRLIRLGMHLDAVVASDSLGDIDNFQMLIDLKRLAPAVPFVMLLSPGPDAEYLKKLSPGIFDYVEKRLAASELRTVLDLALERASGRPAPVFDEIADFPHEHPSSAMTSADPVRERT